MHGFSRPCIFSKLFEEFLQNATFQRLPPKSRTSRERVATSIKATPAFPAILASQQQSSDSRVAWEHSIKELGPFMSSHKTAFFSLWHPEPMPGRSANDGPCHRLQESSSAIKQPIYPVTLQMTDSWMDFMSLVATGMVFPMGKAALSRTHIS